MKKRKLNSKNPKYKTIASDKNVKSVRTVESKCVIRNASGSIVPDIYAKVTAVYSNKKVVDTPSKSTLTL